MSKPKFTPGPWLVLHEGSSEVSVQADKKCICSLNYDPLPKEEVKKHLANANLIAAAPEMYDALKSVCISCQLRDHETDCGRCAIGAAIRKARGESEVSE